MINEHFKSLVEDAIAILSDTINRIKNALETNRRLEREFEHQVLLALKGSAKTKNFDCQPSSPHSFPDIICTHQATGLKFGIEVKTGKTWQTNGNSILTKLGAQDIEDIVVLFCKTTNPIHLAWKRYEDVVSNIAVTHSPRYVIKMDLDSNATFFKAMQTTYKDFKKMSVEEKMGLVKKHHLLNGKTGGQWWMSKE